MSLTLFAKIKFSRKFLNLQYLMGWPIYFSLQGVECGGQKLLIKFPDNPITNGGGPHGTITLRKTPTTSTTTPKRYQCFSYSIRPI